MIKTRQTHGSQELVGCGRLIHRITESQNDRGRKGPRWINLGGSSRPTPLLKQGHLQQAAQDLVQVGLDSSPATASAGLLQFGTGSLCMDNHSLAQ